MKTTSETIRPPSEASLRVEALLRNYARLEQNEIDELIFLFPQLSLIEQWILTTDDVVALNFAEFQRSHGKKIKDGSSGIRHLVVLVALVVVVALFALLSIYR